MTQGTTFEGTGGGGGGAGQSEVPIGFCSVCDAPIYSYRDLPRRFYIQISSAPDQRAS